MSVCTPCNVVSVSTTGVNFNIQSKKNCQKNVEVEGGAKAGKSFKVVSTKFKMWKSFI